MLTRPTKFDPVAGTLNLLQSCIGAKTGETLLIVTEPPDAGCYDSAVCEVIAHQARRLGIDTSVLQCRTATGPDDIPIVVTSAMKLVDHTLFLSRLGDQIRFSVTDGGGTKTVAYTRDMQYLGSEFGCTPWQLFKRVHDHLLEAILAASHYRIMCELGTDLSGDVPIGDAEPALTDFTINYFPMVIYPPLNTLNLNGRLVFDRFLMTTSIDSFDNGVLILDEPLFAIINNNRIVDFEGRATTVDKVRDHFRRVSEFSTGDPWAVHSWHTGIYPQTFHLGDVYADVQLWGELTFASPRYTHFHTCGNPPGNIASATFDATIAFDGENFWDRGRLAFLDRPSMQALLAEYPQAPHAYEMRWDIGL